MQTLVETRKHKTHTALDKLLQRFCGAKYKLLKVAADVFASIITVHLVVTTQFLSENIYGLMRFWESV